MSSQKSIWTTFLLALGVIQLPTFLLLSASVSQHSIGLFQVSVAILAVVCAIGFFFRRMMPFDLLGFVVIAAQLFLISIDIFERGILSPLWVSFMSIPCIAGMIWGWRVSGAILALSAVVFAVIGWLFVTDAISITGNVENTLNSHILWIATLYSVISTSIVGIFCTNVLRQKWRRDLRRSLYVRDEVEQILDNLVEAYFRCDANHQITRTSKTFDALFDNSRHNQKNLLTFSVNPEDLRPIVEGLRNVETPAMRRFSTTMVSKAGKILSVDVRLVRMLNDDQEFIGYEGLIHDRTQLVESEESRIRAEVQKSIVAENIPGAVFDYISRPDGTESLEFLNEKCVEFWNVSEAEALDDPDTVRNKILYDDMVELRRKAENSMRTMKPYGHRCRVKGPNGMIRVYDLRSIPNRQQDGSIRCHYVALDMTSEEATQRELMEQIKITEQAEKQKSIGQLTGGVAHDFNNILAVILGNLDLLEIEEDPSVKENLIASARQATLNGAGLTRSMLAFARRTRLEPTVVDVNDTVLQTQRWAGRTLPANIEVETSLLAGLWTVEADVSSLENALLNLILNARDAMPDGGKLTIETSNLRIDDDYIDERGEDVKTGRYVMLAVSDTGTGIPDEIIERVFEPFFTTKPPGSGSGLGLSMIDGFTRQSGGFTRIYSEENVGTTIKLYFKAVDTDVKTVAKPQIATPATIPDRVKVLLVEDEPAVLTVLTEILKRSGYNVSSAPSGDLALQMFQDGLDVDLMITDIVMPGNLQGTNLAKAVREIHSELPVIFMSGYAAEATVHGNGLRPEDIRLMKPVQSADLLRAIDTALSNQRSKQ